MKLTTIRKFIYSFLASLPFLILPSQVWALEPSDPVGSVGPPTVGTIKPTILGVPIDINQIISGAVQLIIAAAGLIFFAMLILGGFKYLSAGGDEKAVASARSTLTQAFIGLIIVVASFLIASLIFNIFKIQGVTFIK